MKVAGGEKLALASCEPMFTRLRLALRTVPVPASNGARTITCIMGSNF
jgi:hypothetical protein